MIIGPGCGACPGSKYLTTTSLWHSTQFGILLITSGEASWLIGYWFNGTGPVNASASDLFAQMPV